LLVSPYQKHDLIVETGKGMQEKYGVEFYYEDFRPGYREGIKLSKELGLYRQGYCGCIYSKQERAEEKARSAAKAAAIKK
jgi:predicted adenine nucleotide alpha hydrolase (AANH) superfamily ATPase